MNVSTDAILCKHGQGCTPVSPYLYYRVSVCLLNIHLLNIYHGLGILMGRGKMKMKRHGPCPQGIYNLRRRQKPTMKQSRVKRALKGRRGCTDALGPWLEESVRGNKGSP